MEWLHKNAQLTQNDEETGVVAGDPFTGDLFNRLLEEEYAKLLAAGNKDVFEASKTTTLPISREIAIAYVTHDRKLPWFVDLLNINLNNFDLAEAQRRIRLYLDAFNQDGHRITENLDLKG